MNTKYLKNGFLCAIIAFLALVPVVVFAAQLTANSPKTYETGGHINTLPVAGNVIVYKGSAVGMSNGYATQLIAGDTFKGFAENYKDNTAGADGAVNVDVIYKGIALLSVSSVAVTDEGKPVFARDGNTFVLGQEVTNSRIGTVHRYVSSGVAMVRFDADNSVDLTGTTLLTDSSGGASNNTMVAITFPTSLTDNGGGTADGTVQEITNFTMSVTWNGSSVYPSAADGLLLSNTIVALKNNIKEITTELATTRAALTNMVNNNADIAAKLNEIIRAQK